MLQGRLLKNQTKALTVSTSSHVAGDDILQEFSFVIWPNWAGS